MANNNCDLLWYCFFVCVYDVNIDTKERKEIEYVSGIWFVSMNERDTFWLTSLIQVKCNVWYNIMKVFGIHIMMFPDLHAIFIYITLSSCSVRIYCLPLCSVHVPELVNVTTVGVWYHTLYLAVDERQCNKRRTFKPFIAVCTAVTGSSAVGIFAMCNVRDEQGDTQA